MKDFLFGLSILFVFSFICCSYNTSINTNFVTKGSVAGTNPGSSLLSPIADATPSAGSLPGTNEPPLSSPASGKPPVRETPGQMIPVKVTFYTDVGLMADGHPTHDGACAAYLPQFPFGTMLKLYHPNNLQQAVYSCTVEDSGTHICQDNIDVWMASVEQAINLGVQDMQAQIVGLDATIAQDAANNHPTSQTGCELGKTH